MKCLECESLFDANRYNQKFCSTTCSSRYNVRNWKRKKLQKKKESQDGFHQKSWEIMNMTVEQYTNGQGISKFKNAIRNFAQNWVPELKNKPCYICGYDKHVEYAHIKGITTFESTSTLKEINSSSNLIQLCPNCHWEFDNGYFSLYKSDKE